MSALGDVLETARRARGLTQEQLAEAADVTQASLSRYETDQREPDDDTVRRLGLALGVTPEFLRHAGRVQGGMAIDAHMRRRQTAKATAWRQLEAQLNMYRMHASLLFEEVSLSAAQHVPAFDPFETPAEDAARLVRMQWRMPTGPVRNLVRWLEAAGCLVIEEDFGTTRVDGLSQWVGDHPVILINKEAPTDRKRLTLAHELGHLSLHSTDVTADMETEANAFAAEFLMPLEVIRPALRNLKSNRLPDLKREWGVSMQALVERAFRAGLMTPGDRTSLYKMFSARGWRTREPYSDVLPPEVPQLAKTIGDTLTTRGLDPDEIASMAGFCSAEQNSLFRGTTPFLRAL